LAETQTAQLEFRLLGPLEVVRDGDALAIGGAKPRALLAILLLAANEVVARERLIEKLWGATPPPTADTVLNVYVSRLRKLLGKDVLLTRSPGYLLRAGATQIDVRRFEHLVEQAHGAEPGEAARLLREALALFRGPPLADLNFEDFAQREIARLEELRLTATEDRIDADLSLGVHRQVVGELERLVAEHPLRERLRAQLMLALYRSGRQAEALGAYRGARRVLVDELGIEPIRALKELERQILEQDPALHVREAAEPDERVAAPDAPPTRPAARPGRLVVAAAIAVAIAVVIAAAFAFRGSDQLFPVAGSSVAVIDPRTNELVDAVPVGRQRSPGSGEFGGLIAIGEDAVWVADTGGRTISRIDPRSLNVTTNGLGADVFNVAVSAGSVWVTHRTGGASRIDPTDGSVVETVSLSGDGGFPYSLEGIAVGDGSVWIGAGLPGELRLIRLDPRISGREAEILLGTRSNHDIAVGAGAVWITNLLGNVVWRVSTSTHAVEATIPLGSPTAVAVGAGAVWVASNDGSVWRIDPATNLASRQIAVGDGPADVAVAGGAVWIANRDDGTVSRIDPETETVVATVRVADRVVSLAAGTGRIWVTVPEVDGGGASA